MRCPAIEGIETAVGAVFDVPAPPTGRMRCPAIEGIETRRPPGVIPRRRRGRVECVAPLLRGLKRPLPGVAGAGGVELVGSNALPRY